MAKSDPVKRRASFEVNTIREWLGPIHEELIDRFNDRHETVETGDAEAAAELDREIEPLLIKFEATEAPLSANPGWIASKMRAGWCIARGDYADALEYEKKGYEYAVAEVVTPETQLANAKRKSVSASNIADELRRLGDAEKALEWARLSVDLWPSNAINHLVLAMAVYRAGYPTEAGRLIAELLSSVELDNPRDTLANCVAFEQELHLMTDLEPVQKLLRSLNSRHTQPAAATAVGG